ncbi:MAG TPA: gluconate 2-dehydrogenase subunit 3 family protein [Amaricoccus sp.]|uniref:gluconate 2-dehydrogenase subunit 3 family protein n=1 Tax=Amaricoccus sp. TaxID=1872485 RepID=UPI002CBA1E4A|nr:gluconate 2-dehydrogenase subunit 3 family protein [Amaricoccus sp.]HMQ91679.1 gluconate 2-dehydrogenase subunit 3 family protein [Amaricoccus sp.]HMR52218.1 gluconate 2-dehydrogenase subunit 3 family protein [Amaricoccus sp.]HMT99070.1 gluconate 2-dehydrogenase subunit 3 family protein [Amaricoccus sp.]
MPKQAQGGSNVDRRNFLALAAAAGATAGALPPTEAASAAEPAVNSSHAMHAEAAALSRPDPATAAYQFFNVDESAFIEAAIDTLIPSDTVGPGAMELGVATYIDRQMAGAYGKGDRLYLEGPFGEGTPQQGYQLLMTPAELIRAGIADINAHAQKTYRRPFSALSEQDRIAVLTDLEDEKIELTTVPLATFFGLLLQLTVEGYFADPMYGGNKDKAAWKMIGFPGASAMYMDKIEPFRNRPYTVEPMGIADLS